MLCKFNVKISAFFSNSNSMEAPSEKKEMGDLGNQNFGQKLGNP